MSRRLQSADSAPSVVTRRQVAGRTAHLTTHSLAETYSVLTGLPGDARVTPADAATLQAANFDDSIAPQGRVSSNLPAILHNAPPAVPAQEAERMVRF